MNIFFSQLIKKKIKFSTYDICDKDNYLKYLGETETALPSDLYPDVLLGHRDLLHIERGYAGNLVWHRDFYNNEEYWYMPVGNCKDYKKIFKKYVPNGTVFAAVPECMKDILRLQLGNKIYFEHQPDLDDYIIDNRQLIRMVGSDYKGIRNHVNHINREMNIEICDLSNVPADELMEFNRKALSQLDTNNEGIIQEKQISEYLLSNKMQLNLFGTVLKYENKIIGMTINEKGLHDECIGIYMKIDHEIKGMGQYLSVVDAKRQLDKGFYYCNIMADEGEENLKTFKRGLKPCKVVKKYYGFYH